MTTEENVRYEGSLAVRALDGRLEHFQPNILLISLYKSLAHRPSAASDASSLAETIMAALRRQHTNNAEIPLESIKQAAATTLERFDSLAGSHYRAYHASPKS